MYESDFRSSVISFIIITFPFFIIITCFRVGMRLAVHDRLIVSFLLQPSTWVPAEVESSRFIVDEDGQHEWNCW